MYTLSETEQIPWVSNSTLFSYEPDAPKLLTDTYNRFKKYDYDLMIQYYQKLIRSFKLYSEVDKYIPPEPLKPFVDTISSIDTSNINDADIYKICDELYDCVKYIINYCYYLYKQINHLRLSLAKYKVEYPFIEQSSSIVISLPPLYATSVSNRGFFNLSPLATVPKYPPDKGFPFNESRMFFISKSDL